MNRRNFIKQSSVGLALPLAAPAFAFDSNKQTKITILHTNDQHSRIEAFPKSDNPQYSEQGGFARRAALISKIRKEEENVLLLDAGDIFQGTPYFNFFGGELEFKLMSKLKYDASTMGNHDFDNGLKGFEKQLKHANFDFICSNYDFSNTLLDGKTKSYKIIRKSGVKIGIFGLGIELKNLVPDDLFLETKYLDPVEIAQDMTRLLREEKNCDLVICLSHLGLKYENETNKICDEKLAQKTDGIDLIIGGHTHSFLTEPESIKNKKGETVLVNQVGWAGLFLGRVDFYFDKKSKQTNYSSLGRNLPINSFV